MMTMIEQGEKLKEQFAFPKRKERKLRPEDKEVIAEINSMNPKHVLDVGCGANIFKQYIPNVIGIDIVNTNADIVCDILDLDFPDNYFDAIIAFTSLQFGDLENTYENFRILTAMLAEGGKMFVRMNPSVSGVPEADDGQETLRSPVTPEHVLEFAKDFGVSVVGDIMYVDKRLPGKARSRGNLVFVYQKNGNGGNFE